MFRAAAELQGRNPGPYGLGRLTVAVRLRLLYLQLSSRVCIGPGASRETKTAQGCSASLPESRGGRHPSRSAPEVRICGLPTARSCEPSCRRCACRPAIPDDSNPQYAVRRGLFPPADALLRRKAYASATAETGARGFGDPSVQSSRFRCNTSRKPRKTQMIPQQPSGDDDFAHADPRRFPVRGQNIPDCGMVRVRRSRRLFCARPRRFVGKTPRLFPQGRLCFRSRGSGRRGMGTGRGGQSRYCAPGSGLAWLHAAARWEAPLDALVQPQARRHPMLFRQPLCRLHADAGHHPAGPRRPVLRRPPSRGLLAPVRGKTACWISWTPTAMRYAWRS